MLAYPRTVASFFALIAAASLLVLPFGTAADSTASMDKYLGHISTDKPIYRAGETVYLRAVVLSATDHKPLPMDQSFNAIVRIAGPRGETVVNRYTAGQDSVAAFNWQVPGAAAGGQYTATFSFPFQGFPPAVRKFEVRAYRTPRLKGEIIFLHDGYGPGATVQASLHVERAEGGLPAGADVTVNAVVDGADAYHGSTKIDANGNCSVQFPLPAHIEQGDGTLSLAIADGGVVEPIAKTIPILLNTVDITFYPEGGDLIAGLPNRVYVEARTPAKKPADLVGVIVDSRRNVVAQLRTEHEGRGRFTFTPVAGETYALELSQPTGIARNFPLPDSKPKGVAIQSTSDVLDADGPVLLQLTSTDPGNFTVSLSKRDIEVSSLTIKLAANQPASLMLTPPAWADGVLIATVKDHTGNPLAERLVFRKPARAIHVQVTANKPTYLPAGDASLTITTTDDDGRPVPAVVGLAVTDESVLKMIEKRDRAPRLGAMVLLENDVRELADADLYLDPTDFKAPLATDLLLGTQGWRRFATADETKFMSTYGDSARRILADRQREEFDPTTQADETKFDLRKADAADDLPRGQFAAGAPMQAMVPPQMPASLAAASSAVPMAADDSIILPIMPDAEKDADMPVRLSTPPNPVVRIYAHDLRPGFTPGQRTDFTETLYWAAGIKTDAQTGTATVNFKLSDSVTTFKATADAFTDGGALGQGDTTIASIRPFYIEPKLPLEVTCGDVIRLPIAAVNAASDNLQKVLLSITAGNGLTVTPVDPFPLAAGARERRISQILVAANPGPADITIRATAGDYSDQITRTLIVKSAGFPTQIAYGGLLNPRGIVGTTIRIPATIVPHSIITSAVLYPTPLGNLTEALRRLLQEPSGCFEQTSSTTYPLVMADQYFLTHTGVDPQLIQQSNDLLQKGYDRLRSFECQNKGYEWFGEDPGHECLTAFGLLEFTDMSACRPVDPTMLANTRNWLLARRDGKGGYTHERRSMHTWITDPGCANGYCTWALLECGQTGLDTEVKWLKQDAAADPNSYVIALAANVMSLAGDHDAAKMFMEKLAAQQAPDGHVLGATTSVVGSQGDSLQIETTSLAALAWLRDPAYSAQVEKAMKFLADSCQDGRYGSTQSTVLALRAIITYDKIRAHPTDPGAVQLFVDAQPIGTPFPFSADTHGAIKLPDFSSKMTPGDHAIELRMTDGSPIPYTLTVNFNSLVPASSDKCRLSIQTHLQDTQVAEGAATEQDVVITNKTDQILPSPIAIVGIPGGLEVRHDQLKELVKAERIAAYEVRGREVILYWRDLQPNRQVQIPMSLMAAIPGTYTAPASRAYLYYTDEDKQWAAGTKVTVMEK